MVISHDTEFLNAVANKIVHIDKTSHKISVFDGNYADFKRKDAALRHARDVKIKAQERQISHLSDFISRANAASPTNHSIKKAGHTRAAQLEKYWQTV